MSPTATAGVLLIDLENMIGQLAKPKTLASKLDALLLQAGPGLDVVVACADSRISQEGKRILSDRCATVLLVGGAKDAADAALLKEARRLAATGHRRFVIASADGAFGELADLGQLEIMLWQGQPGRQKAYLERAHKVHKVPFPASAPTKGATPAAPKSPPKTTAAPSPSLRATVPIPDHLTLQAAPSSASASPPCHHPGLHEMRSALLFAGAIFTAGTLFGAGSAIGATVARQLLRSFQR